MALAQYQLTNKCGDFVIMFNFTLTYQEDETQTSGTDVKRRPFAVTWAAL
jgi:hypothetical protein